MRRNSEKTENNVLISKQDYLLSLVNSESNSINEAFGIINKLCDKYGVCFSEIATLLENQEKYISLPIGLFRSELGPLEAVVKYLRDILEYNLSSIAKLLARDETTIWTTYHNSKKKELIVDLELEDIDFNKMKVAKESLIVPLSLFSERRLSILESLCIYLKENFNLTYHKIALIISRDDRTVWTVVNRAKQKLKKADIQ